MPGQTYGGSFHIVGGAVWPETIAATWPLAILSGDGTGLSVDLRWALVKRISIKIFDSVFQERPPLEGAWWTSTWDDLARVATFTR